MRASRRGTAASVAAGVVLSVVLVSINACFKSYRWTAKPVTELELQNTVLKARLVRFETDSGSVTMQLERLAFPFVYGRVVTSRSHDARDTLGRVEIMLHDVRRIRLARDDDELYPRAGKIVAEVNELGDSLEGDVSLVNGHTIVVDFVPFGRTVLRESRLVTPAIISGRLSPGSSGLARFDVSDLKGMSIRELKVGRTFANNAIAAGATVAFVALLVAATKESCPFVYIDIGNGWELRGEAYAGAAFQSTQREDLLPLAAPGERAIMRVRLRNEARETQYTDRAELWMVDHPQGLRAVSTYDGRPILVGKSLAPTRADDRTDRELTGLLAAQDGVLAETTADAVATTPDSVLSEVITAEFEPVRGGTPVLELTAGNTSLLDLTFGRFFAAMGNRLDHYIRLGADPQAGPRIRGWREREGVDLIVEQYDSNGWKRVAAVPTVGPAMLREIAVPLIDVGGPIIIRLRSGLGFWRIDRLGLSTMADDSPTVHRLAPVRAVESDGRDTRTAIQTGDGRYQQLVAVDATLDMEFALPVLARGQSRAVFLSSSGYYTVHPPVQGEWLPGTLKAIRDEPGAFARFGRDLARAYESMALIASSGQ